MSSKLAILYFIIGYTLGNESTLVSRTKTSFLDKYESYKDVVLIRLQVPQNTLSASFMFTAEDTQMSIFTCKPRKISLYMKHGAPPVINPDGSEFPASFKNISRNKIYSLEFKTDDKNIFLNISSPEPGYYYAATFISYTDPKFNAITQQGLSPSCYATIEAIMFAEKIENPLIITNDDLVEVISDGLSSRYFKFFATHTYNYLLIKIETLNLSENIDRLILRVDINKPPSPEVHQLESIIYKNSSWNIPLWTQPDSWYFIEFRFDSNTVEKENTSINNATFKLKVFSNKLSNDHSEYDLLTNDTFYNNSATKIYQSGKVTEMLPYKQYDLIRDASSETFVFSFVLEDELEANMAVPINMTNKHFSVLKYRIRDSSEVGGTLQFIMAFKPRIKKRSDDSINFEGEPQNHTIVACIRKDSIEIPTWPDQCVSQGDSRDSYLILNRTVENNTIMIPYPETGTWYATFRLFCGDCKPCDCPEHCQRQYEDCKTECELDCITFEECSACSNNCTKRIIETKDCKGCDCDGACLKNNVESCNTSVVYDISAHPCVNGQCSTNGKCMFMVSDGIVFSTCVCVNKYRGWDCTDGSQATPYYMVVIELLLLVLSNLAFLPAVYIAFKRKYYIESITYFGICFFSTFYHSCDAGENIISYCVVRLDSLQFGDFFCALLSIWVTLIAIADLPSLFTSIAHMSGAIILAFCTTVNKTALWIFALPVCTGILIVTISWYLKYRKVKQRFANRRYLLVQMPLGIGLVSVGLIVYAFLQTENNYKYLHSMWHIMMASAIIVILPKPNTFLPEVLL